MHRSGKCCIWATTLMLVALSVEAGGFLGVSTKPVNPLVAEHLDLPGGAGLQIVHVVEAGPSAGILEENDILYKLDGQMLINHDQLATLVRRQHAAGDTVECELLRRGKRITEKIKLGEAPEVLPHPLRGQFRDNEEPRWQQGARSFRRRWHQLPEDLESAQRRTDLNERR